MRVKPLDVGHFKSLECGSKSATVVSRAEAWKEKRKQRIFSEVDFNVKVDRISELIEWFFFA